MTTFAEPNDPVETKWLYDEPTGLLTNKVYDDGTGPTYTYYPNGQLCTRTWARGIVATYTYNIFGELVSTTYSDDTPSISNTYNRLGQKTQVIQSTAADQRITTYEYDTNTFALLSESINGTNRISYSYNPQGQQTAYSSSPNLGEVTSRARSEGFFIHSMITDELPHNKQFSAQKPTLSISTISMVPQWSHQ
jgi:YD repeat-containing protein